MTAQLPGSRAVDPWCGMCRRKHAVIACEICSTETHYSQPLSRICTRCKHVMRTARLHGIDPPQAPLTSRREFWLPAGRLALVGKYLVSNRGRIRSTRTGKVLVATKPRKGYPGVTVGGQHVRIHTLVLETWVGPRPPGQECCHRDDIRSHNHVRNLGWGSRSENTVHSVRNGRHPNARKRECRNGHRCSPENTYRDKRGRRVCKICQRAATLRWKARTGREGRRNGAVGAAERLSAASRVIVARDGESTPYGATFRGDGMTGQTVGNPDGSRTLWCRQCRREHAMPVCTCCRRELPDLPHRLVWLCDECKAAARNALRENA